MTNRYKEKNVGHQRLSSIGVTISAGGNNLELIAAPGAGKRLRVFGVIVDNNGTAAADVVIRFGTSGQVIFDNTLPTGSDPLPVMFSPHYVEGGSNVNLQADVNDQATDDVKVTIYYQVEDE